MNKIIGLVGEDPNDTLSIKHLLEQKIHKNISYILLIKNKNGNQLDNARTRASLKIECERKKPDIIIFIRDADGICTENEKINKCKTWFNSLNKDLNGISVLLLNIYELEALIFTDIDVFNAIYKTNIKGNRNITYIKEPKEELIRQTRNLQKKYSVSDCPEIFKRMNIQKVIDNCIYFNEFYQELNKHLENTLA